MNLPRLLPPSLALCALLLAACGNKADLFMPPPPDDEEIDAWDGEDDAFDEDAGDDIQDDPPVSPPPVPTGTEPAQAPIPDIEADDDPEPPPAGPVDDE